MLDSILFIVFLVFLLYFLIGFKGIRLLFWIVAVVMGVLWLINTIAT